MRNLEDYEGDSGYYADSDGDSENYSEGGEESSSYTSDGGDGESEHYEEGKSSHISGLLLNVTGFTNMHYR